MGGQSRPRLLRDHGPQGGHRKDGEIVETSEIICVMSEFRKRVEDVIMAEGDILNTNYLLFVLSINCQNLESLSLLFLELLKFKPIRYICTDLSERLCTLEHG